MDIEANGIRINYTIEGEGPPIVLLHGYTLDRSFWDPQVRALRRRYRVIVPDLRGFGAARDQVTEPDGTTMDLLADDLARLLDARGLDQVVLGGLSLGSYLAYAFLRRHPGRLGGLILFSTTAAADTDETRAARMELAKRVEGDGIGVLPEAMLPRLLGPTSLEQRPELVERVRALIVEQDPAGVVTAEHCLAARPDSFGDLGAVAVPTLVISGAEDMVTGPDQGRAVASAIRDARFVLVEGAGHLVNLEQPEQVNEALLNFIAPIWI